MTPATEWVALPPGASAQLVAEGLQPDVDVTFAVLVRNNATGVVSSYTAARGVPSYEKVTQAASDTTIVAFGAGAAGVFIVLVGAAYVLRARVARKIERGATKYGRKYMPVFVEEGGGGGDGAGGEEAGAPATLTVTARRASQGAGGLQAAAGGSTAAAGHGLRRRSNGTDAAGGGGDAAAGVGSLATGARAPQLL
jgi:hypothetical protein